MGHGPTAAPPAAASSAAVDDDGADDVAVSAYFQAHAPTSPPPTLPYSHILWACLCAFLEKFAPGHFHFNVISFKFIVNGNLCFAFALLPLHLQLHNRVVRRACSFV